MAVKYWFMKWDSAANKWYACDYMSRFYYNSKTVHKVYVYWRRSSLKCGVGYYATIAKSYVYNNGWRGGSMWSPNHYLPSS